MKKIKNKYIRLTEQQLNLLIKEGIKKELSLLNEFAIPRSKFIDKVAALSNQIIENWCLVRYCTLTNSDVNNCKNHWKKELFAHISNIGNDNIKGHKSYEVKLKAIVEGFEYKDLFDGVDRIFNLISAKFINEGIDIKNNQMVKQVCEDCSNALKEIIEQMANFSVDETLAYIDKI